MRGEYILQSRRALSMRRGERLTGASRRPLRKLAFAQGRAISHGVSALRRLPFGPMAAPLATPPTTARKVLLVDDDPFMLKVYRVRPDKRAVIPAVTHVDGTGRLQTVERAHAALYWELIHAFGEQTGVPVVLNTSFNENEPIVRTPQEAIDCFMRTKMDALAIGNYLVKK